MSWLKPQQSPHEVAALMVAPPFLAVRRGARARSDRRVRLVVFKRLRRTQGQRAFGELAAGNLWNSCVHSGLSAGIYHNGCFHSLCRERLRSSQSGSRQQALPDIVVRLRCHNPSLRIRDYRRVSRSHSRPRSDINALAPCRRRIWCPACHSKDLTGSLGARTSDSADYSSSSDRKRRP